MATGDTTEPEYDVALSFAGAQRDYVRAVASELNKHGIRVFYDEDDEVALWGKDLGEELQRIYMSASSVVVMFVSADYAEKSWPIHERRSAMARAINERREYVLPVRFDDTVLPGLSPSVSYLPLTDRPAAKLAKNIMAKLVQLGGRVQPAKPAFRAKEASDGSPNHCRITVNDGNGKAVTDATVVLISASGLATEGRTGPDGVAEIPAAVRRAVSVFIAHPDHRAAVYHHHDNGTELEVMLPAGDGIHSIAFPRDTGYIPGLKPRLNPIGDRYDTGGVPHVSYMYVSNGSIDGRPRQPYHFTVGQPMMLEDSDGNQARVTCVGFVGHCTLWEYEYPE